MNRRSFFKAITGFAAGVVAAFLPSEHNGGIEIPDTYTVESEVSVCGQRYKTNIYAFECTIDGETFTFQPPFNKDYVVCTKKGQYQIRFNEEGYFEGAS